MSTRSLRFQKFFSPALYLQGIRRLRVAGIAMTICVVIFNALLPLSAGGGGYSDAPPNHVDIISSFAEFAPATLLLAAFAPLLAFIMFSFLNKRHESDFYHALPQTRLCVFWSLTAACMTWILGVLLLTFGLNLLLWSLVPQHAVLLSAVLPQLLCYLLCALLTMSIALLAIALTGTLVSNLFVALLLLLFFRVTAALWLEYLSTLAPVYDFEASLSRLWLIDRYYPFALFFAVVGGSTEETRTVTDLPIVLYTVCLTLALLILAAYLYHRRRSEIAGRSALHPLLQHVYRCAVTLPLLLFAVVDMAAYGFDISHLWVIAIALVLYLLYELATTRRLSSLPVTLPVFGIVVVATLLLLGSAHAIAPILREDVPARSRVEGVSVDPDSMGLRGVEDPVRLDHPQAVELVMEALEFTAPQTEEQFRAFDNQMGNQLPQYEGYRRLSVCIHTDTGRTLHRLVRITPSKLEQLQQILLSSEEYLDLYLALPPTEEIYALDFETANITYVSAPQSRAEQLFREEYARLDREQQLQIRTASESYGSTPPLIRLYLRCKTYSKSFVLCSDAFPETIAYLLEQTESMVHEGDKALHISEFVTTVTSLDMAALAEKNHSTGLQTDFVICLKPCHSYPSAEIPQGLPSYFASVHTSSAPPDQKIPDLLAMSDAVAQLKTLLPTLFSYHDSSRQLYFLELHYSGLPCSTEPTEQENEKLCQDDYINLYVMLSDAEAHSLIAAIGAINQDTKG